MVRPLVLLAVALLLGALVVPSAGATGAAASTLESSDRDGSLSYRLSLTPDQPGEIEVTATATLPESVTRLRLDLDERQTAIEANGFEADGPKEWRWDGETSRPSLTYAVAVNRSNEHVEGIDTADVGEWALFTLADVGVDYQYWYVGGQPTFGREYAVDGEGVAGSHLAYLGPHERYERAANGETFVLVVPATADLEDSPEAILGTLAGASGQLSVGPRREQIHAFAVPYHIRRGGLAVGGDFWVTDGTAVAHPNNVWVHEYVHTRQRFETTAETRWLTEASAEYYAALLTWRQGQITADRFLGHLGDDRYGDAVLSRPETWEDAFVPYIKGQLVLAALDAAIRAETDGRASGQDVLAWLNEREEPVTHGDLADAIAAVAGTRFDGWLDRYVRAGGQPSLPDDPAAFGRPDDRPNLDPGRVEFELRGTWTADPDAVPSGVSVPVRYRSDEPVTLEAGAGAIMFGDGTVELLDDPSEVVVRSAVDPDVTVTVSVPTSDDVDRDGLANAAERDRGTDLWTPDTDDDGLYDGQEVMRGTDPLLVDTDGDSLGDHDELTEYGTDPLLVDTDEDGLDDGDEVNAHGTDPTVADTDEDGYVDGREVEVGTDPTAHTSWWRFTLADIRYRFTAWLG